MSVIEQALRQARDQSRTAAVRNPPRLGHPPVECLTALTLAVASPQTAGADLKKRENRQGHRPWVARLALGIVVLTLLTGVVAYSLLNGTGTTTHALPHPAVQLPAPAATTDNGSSRSLVKSAEQSSLEVVPDSFRATGVIVGDNAAYAVVNGSLVTVGDKVDGAVVVAIDESTVRLRSAGQEFAVSIDP